MCSEQLRPKFQPLPKSQGLEVAEWVWGPDGHLPGDPANTTGSAPLMKGTRCAAQGHGRRNRAKSRKVRPAFERP